MHVQIVRELTGPLAMVMIVLIATVAYNIPSISFNLTPVNNEGKYEFSNATVGPQGVLDESFVIMGIFFSLFLIVVAFILKHRKDLSRRMGYQSIFWDLIAGALFIIFINLVLLAGNRISINLSAQPIKSGALINATVFYAAFLLILLLILLSLMGGRKSKIKEKTVKRDYKKFVERAIKHVQITEDVRGAILQAYREMEKMISIRGMKDAPYHTPREFRDFALNELKLSMEPVETLVSLFETARYSTHTMSEENRKDALDALEAIKNELGS